jgi:hypothetical protein
MMRYILFAALVFASWHLSAGERPWYTQGKFKPTQRLEFTLSNNLDINRKNNPVVIKRDNFPVPDVHEMWVTVVDPDLPPFEGPSEELLRLQGDHQLRAETNGHAQIYTGKSGCCTQITMESWSNQRHALCL